MLTSPLLSSSFLPALKALDSRTIPRPTSKVSILKLNLHSRRELGGGIRRTGVSHQKKDMAGLARMDAIAGAADGPREEDEDGAALSNSGYLAVKGFGTTLNRMSKWLVVAFFALFILWKHDAEALWVAMGSIVNSCISVTLKRTLNQQRPVNASKSDPGMPSSHAQAIFYTATYLVISLFDWPGVNIFTMTIGAITFISSSYLSWLRVSQQFHTISQVFVGAALGSACAATWFCMWHLFVQAAFMASLWVRIVVVLGSISFCTAFVIYVIQQWVGDED
ncbi:lipid phosphate phosphatase epsilon 2, chloroplastic-like isoform X1 [Iris pallida]|uniref:Lipid phosphate phosphatase epsilon 2, chloroplastic-like isoform X1 n=1 Tax=Iris pallida TaxID=29817 RepID=A0AAX6E5H7_IRIPA|nr:lipid phosphate phosphatase epsilon 2, chloroplastic-like isoform X1 [Iris pallida]